MNPNDCISMREFNITGSIIPEEHYYVDLKPQLDKLMQLVEKRKYFVINRPRQYGKTTLLDFLTQHLHTTGLYAPAFISFEGFTQRTDITEEAFYGKLTKLIFDELASFNFDPTESNLPASKISNRDDFFVWLRAACQSLPGKLVLMIDEIDAVPETVVVGFLAGLREMYLMRRRKAAPNAVCLAGVRDIKNLQARYRDETRSLGSASPFNIAIDYEIPPFSLENIRQYYLQHTENSGQCFDEHVFVRVRHVTNGHPWLVSVLAKYMVEDFVPDRSRKILPDHAEKAIQKLVNSRNANFESLFNNARKPELFPIVLGLLTGKHLRYNIQSDKIDLGVKFGVFAERNGQLILANPIYAQVLYHHFEEQLDRPGAIGALPGKRKPRSRLFDCIRPERKKSEAIYF